MSNPFHFNQKKVEFLLACSISGFLQFAKDFKYFFGVLVCLHELLLFNRQTMAVCDLLMFDQLLLGLLSVYLRSHKSVFEYLISAETSSGQYKTNCWLVFSDSFICPFADSESTFDLKKLYCFSLFSMWGLVLVKLSISFREPETISPA